MLDIGLQNWGRMGRVNVALARRLEGELGVRELGRVEAVWRVMVRIRRASGPCGRLLVSW